MIAPPFKAGVVSDTGPINYLLQIGHVELLHRLFRLIWVPTAVLIELTDRGAPERVRNWIEHPPVWFVVTKPFSQPCQEVGGAGERAAITLAAERRLPLLCDDEAARRTARREGLAVVGTLGVLQQAHSRRMIEIAPAVEDLLKLTNFYVSAGLIERVIREAEAMRELADYR